MSLTRTAEADGVIDKRLRLNIQPRFGAMRGQAPLPLKIALTWSDPQLLEGHLILRWYVNQTHLGTYTSPAMALSSGSVMRNVMLPPVIIPNEESIFSIQAEFLAEDRLYDLEVHDIFIPLDWRRTFIAGICREPPLQIDKSSLGLPGTDSARLTQSLRLEPFFNVAMNNRELSTMVVEVPPAELPTRPLEYMGFDVVIVPTENIASLTDGQLRALTTWIEAGGSLGIHTDSPVEPSFVEILNRLTGDPDVDATYMQTKEGRLLPSVGDVQGIDLHHCELGRLVVARGGLDYESPEWQRAVQFLFKVRHHRIEEWAEGEVWDVEMPPGFFDYIRPLSFQPERTLAAAWIEEMLLPQTIEGIPLVTVCSILGLFLLMIAPGDYLLLGWIKRRRWTWVLFPAMSLLFTLLMIKLAEAHLGSANLERSITIVDLARDGRPLRSTRIDLLYPAFSRQVVNEHETSWMVPVEPDTAESNAQHGMARIMPDYESAWDYTGSLPGRHVVQRDIRQWSPRLSRTTTLGSDPLTEETPLSGFDWSQVTLDRTTQPAGMAQLSETLHGLDPDVEMKLMQNTLNARLDKTLPVRTRVFHLVEFMTYIADSHLFRVVSQVSPTGAGNWEDLAMYDYSDDQSVFIVMTESRDGHYVVYRKLLTKEN
ncbi:MAG: hypothetical protein KDA93_08685 [Planctomycetaceae bacterium]|nr:hypothetical protein [Planctomycetaceae bacterium]